MDNGLHIKYFKSLFTDGKDTYSIILEREMNIAVLNSMQNVRESVLQHLLSNQIYRCLC